MSATAVEMQTQEPLEAVIISGPRKGEIITVPRQEMELSPAEEAVFDALAADFERVIASMRGFSGEVADLVQELRRIRRSNESLGTSNTDERFFADNGR